MKRIRALLAHLSKQCFTSTFKRYIFYYERVITNSVISTRVYFQKFMKKLLLIIDFILDNLISLNSKAPNNYLIHMSISQ